MKEKITLALSSDKFRSCFILLFSLLISAGLSAQTVTGRVSDREGNPVSGATVAVKGTNRATVTNASGNFSINATGRNVLVVTFVGFTTSEVPINGRNSLSVNLTPGESTMSEVIVTALGIKRESRKLGYSATSVNTDELIANRTTNVGESLEGKVAGLNITPPAAGAGASNQIRLRGQVGFSGADNSPLIVINGLPMDQNARNNEGNNPSRDRGDNLANINPD